MSVLWSADGRSFEPIHLDGDALASFEQTARRARQTLAEAGLGSAAAEGDLVNLGRDLHARFFAGAVGAEVAGWLRGVDAVESLEIGTDAPGRIPFALFDDPQQPGPWGRRFPLAVGHRVSPLRTFAQLATTNVIVAIDADLRSQLSEASRIALEAFTVQTGVTVVDTRHSLTDLIKHRVPDVIWLLARLEGGAWHVGGQRLTPQDLRQTIRDAEAGNALPVVISTGVAGAEATLSWECFLSAATAALPGLVSFETPASANAACDIGLSLLTAFLTEKLPIARALQQVRLGAGPLGLSFASFAPPLVRVLREGDVEPSPARPLPEEPYHPLRPLEREDRALLFGRDDDIETCAAALDQPNTAGLLIHGRAGIGKASLVRAGLLPFLEDENRGFYVLRDRTDAAESEADQPTIALRTGPDLAGSLVMGMAAFAARPFLYTTPTGRTVSVDLPAIVLGSTPSAAPQSTLSKADPTSSIQALDAAPTSDETPPAVDVPAQKSDAPSPEEIWATLRNDPTAVADLLDRLTRDLPFELLIPVEQLEDLVALPSSRVEEAANTLPALARSPGRFKIIATMRTEFLGQVQPLLGQDYSRAGWKDHFLDELSEDAIQEALLAPTEEAPLPYASEAPADKYDFRFDAGVGARILTYVKEQTKTSGYTAIELVQAFGGQLFESRVSSAGGVRPGDVNRIIKRGAVDTLVENKLRGLGLPAGDRRAALGLLRRMHRTHGPLVTRDLVSLDHIKSIVPSATPIQRVVNRALESGPLLEAHNLLVHGKEHLYVTVPQDTLAQYGALQDRLSESKRFARQRIWDALFILIPVTVLVMSLAFFVISNYRSRAVNTRFEAVLKQEVERSAKLGRDVGGASTRFAVYSGAIAQAEAALQQGNTLRARQMLLTQQPQQSDIRGFEWFYLWKKMNGEEISLQGHKAQPRLVAMSADGKRLASGDEAGNVLLWNLDDLKEPLLATLKGLRLPVAALAVAPDGAVAASDGGKLLVWEPIKPGREVPSVEAKVALVGDGKGINCLAFVGDAKSLAAGDQDHSLTLFDVPEKKAKWTAREHTAPVKYLAVNKDGGLASASDQEVIVWTNAGKKDKADKLGDNARIGGLTWRPEKKGTLLFAATRPDARGMVKHEVMTFDLASGLHAPWREFGSEFSGLAVAPTVDAVAAAGQAQQLRLWTNRGPDDLIGHVSAVRSITGGGSRLASVGFDNSIKVWNVEQRLQQPEWLSPSGRAMALAFDPSERILASGGFGGIAEQPKGAPEVGKGAIQFWDASTGAEVGHIDVPAAVNSLAFLAGPKSLLLAAATGNDAQVWEVAIGKDGVTAKSILTLKKHSAAVMCLAFTENGKYLITGGLDKAINFWSIPDGKHVSTTEVPAGVTALSCEGPLILIGDSRGVAAILIPGAEERPRVYQAHGAAINAIALLRQTKFRDIATVSADQSFRLWASDEHDRFDTLKVYRGHYQPLTCLVQGRGFFATGGLDGTVKFWDYTLSEERSSLAIGSPVRALALANDRALLAVADSERGIRLIRSQPKQNYGPVNLPPARSDARVEQAEEE